MFTNPIVVAAGYTLIVAAAGGFLTKLGPWYYGLRFPSWKPPDWLFGPAWTVILTLAATSAVLAWRVLPEGGLRTTVVVLFLMNGVLNMAWSGLYFRLQRPDWALVEVMFLEAVNIALIVLLAPVSTTASLCMVPYAVWVAFASYLNLTIVRLNRPFGKASA